MTTYPISVTVTDSAGASATATTSATVATAASITIGNTTVITATHKGDGNAILAQQVSLTQVATIQSLSFYVNVASGGLLLGIYDATGPSGHPGKLLAATAVFTPVVGWNTANVTTQSVLQPGNYWLAFFPQNNALTFPTSWVTGSYVFVNATYGTLPSTFPTTVAGSGAATFSFYATLSTVVDTIAPSTPANLTATGISSSMISVSWNASTDNVGVVGYKVFRDDVLIATVTGLSYTDSGLAPSTVYGYIVEAFDAAGNVSMPQIRKSSGQTLSGGGGGPLIPANRLYTLADGTPAWNTYTGIPGGIPNRTSIAATFSPGATAAAIQAALIAASADQVVFLNAGTYTAASLGGTINFNSVKNVSLRGAGLGVTILQGGKIFDKAGGGGTSDGRAITGATKGGFTCSVASASGLSVGMGFEISRDADSNLIPPSFNIPTNHRQQNVITNISGTTLTVRNPWIYDFSIGNPIMVFTYAAGGTSFNPRVGIEDLTLDFTGHSASGQFFYMDQFWLDRVEAFGGTGIYFFILGVLNFQARQCYLHDGGSGPNNSGLLLDGNTQFGGSTSNWKIEDCISNNLFPFVEVDGGCSGGYAGYNYCPGSNSGVAYTLDDGHEPYNFFNLYEGNDVDTIGMDAFFGGSGFGTILRNYSRGVNPNVGTGGIGSPIRLLRMAYYYNVVGNILQEPATANAYSGCAAGGQATVYELGFPNLGNCNTTDQSGNVWTPGPQGGYPDSNVAATLFRWGNYDYFNNATLFNNSEVPSTISPYPVPIPVTHSVPNSYVYSSTPSWWIGASVGTPPPWPPIGPDIAGGNADTVGFVYKIPARQRLENGTP